LNQPTICNQSKNLKRKRSLESVLKNKNYYRAKIILIFINEAQSYTI
jgi:hypothetical protein